MKAFALAELVVPAAESQVNDVRERRARLPRSTISVSWEAKVNSHLAGLPPLQAATHS